MKKFLSFVLAICMLATLFSMAFTAFAAEEGYNKNGNTVVLLAAIAIGLIIAGVAIYNNFMKE